MLGLYGEGYAKYNESSVRQHEMRTSNVGMLTSWNLITFAIKEALCMVWKCSLVKVTLKFVKQKII